MDKKHKYGVYSEEKPHYIRMVCWRILNATIFIVLPKRFRLMLLRLFGAKIGCGAIVYRSVRIYAPWNLSIGSGGVIGPCVEIYNKAFVRVGQRAVISQRAFCCTASHDVSSPVMSLVAKPIAIGDYAWIASRALILPGVTIGEGSVVGAGAVVSNNVEPWTVVGGNPAKFIKKRVLKDD